MAVVERPDAGPRFLPRPPGMHPVPSASCRLTGLVDASLRRAPGGTSGGGLSGQTRDHVITADHRRLRAGCPRRHLSVGHRDGDAERAQDVPAGRHHPGSAHDRCHDDHDSLDVLAGHAALLGRHAQGRMSMPRPGWPKVTWWPRRVRAGCWRRTSGPAVSLLVRPGRGGCPGPRCRGRGRCWRQR